jgi:hypothetical protein
MLSGCASFFSLENFESAQTSAEIVSMGGQPLPASWEVGVKSHGKYYKWFSKSLHPVAFDASIAGMVVSVTMFFMAYQINKRTHQKKATRP